MNQDNTSKSLRIDLAVGGIGIQGVLINYNIHELLSQDNVAVMAVDYTGHIKDTNQRMLSFLERRSEDLRGRLISEVIPGFDQATIDLINVESAKCPIILTAVCLRRGGHSAPVTFMIHSIKGNTPADNLFCLKLTDAANVIPAEEHHVVQSRLDRAERLETAGTVAGQIAHDFNNLLTPLIAYPQLIRKVVAKDSPAQEYLDLMEKTARDMSHLTQQLLSLSRRGQMVQEPFNVNMVIERVLVLLKPMLPLGINVAYNKAEQPMEVRGTKEQMMRVVQNICQNAIDAMGETGTLTINTENIYLDAPFGQYETVNTGEYVKVSISDTGSGIPRSIMDRIFDPFFTTKRASKQRGSGLGLSIVHGIVKDHGGYIDLESEVGKGTTFYVYIPTHREIAIGEAEPTPEHHKETILVVDDDVLQVTMLCDMLKIMGYQASGALSGEEAISMVRDQKRRYDLVILDMILPFGPNGLATFKVLRSINADQKVILMSGFAHASTQVMEAQALGAGIYLHKPIESRRLAAAVHKTLYGVPPQGAMEIAEKKKIHDREPAAIKPVAKPPSAAAQPARDTSERVRILLADDDRLIRRLFSLIIAAEFPEVQIDQASDGDEAIQLFQTQPYHILLMDLQMPRVAGREAVIEIYRFCKEKGIKEPAVVFCTGFAPPDSLAEFIGDGSRNMVLRKPVRVEDLVSAIRRNL